MEGYYSGAIIMRFDEKNNEVYNGLKLDVDEKILCFCDFVLETIRKVDLNKHYKKYMTEFILRYIGENPKNYDLNDKKFKVFKNEKSITIKNVKRNNMYIDFEFYTFEIETFRFVKMLEDMGCSKIYRR